MLALRKFKFARIVMITSALISIIFLVFFLDFGNGIVDGWPPDQSRDVKQYIMDGEELDVQVLPDDFCQKKVFLLTLVTSSPKNHDHRSAVRQTYGAKKTSSDEEVALYFVVGSSTKPELQDSIMNENSLYGDIIIGNFIDSYNNLTLKTVFLLGLVSSYCQNSTTYILKTDDDVYVNLDLLVHDLRTHYQSKNHIIGHVYHEPPKITRTSDKWFTPDYMYPNRIFPDFVSGTGYVISTDAVPKLYKTALVTPYLHLEDVFVTGICAAKSNVTLIGSNKFIYDRRIDVCIIRNRYTVHWTTRLSPLEILQIDELMNSKAALEDCDKLPYNTFNSFLNVFS